MIQIEFAMGDVDQELAGASSMVSDFFIYINDADNCPRLC